jgi:hypothetical protein
LFLEITYLKYQNKTKVTFVKGLNQTPHGTN